MSEHYVGKLYRALNPIYARAPLSGRGAELYGGRFNPKGMAALYTSVSIMTAIREANQIGNLQPITLVSYDADIERIFDTRDDNALHKALMDTAALADTAWRDQMKNFGEAKTQTFARLLFNEGYNGVLVPSYSAGATADDLNLVLWRWGAQPPTRLRLIDEEKRLS